MLLVIVVCLIPPRRSRCRKTATRANTSSLTSFWPAARCSCSVAVVRLLWVAVGLVLMGIGIEFAQGALTDDRMADPMDAIANTVGVLAGMGTALTPCATCCCAGAGNVVPTQVGT